MKGNRILMLTRYTAAGPSSRVRFYQYLPYLEKAGYVCEVRPFFDAAYIKALFAGRKPAVDGVLRAYARRMMGMLSGEAYDLVWMQYELLPWLPYGLERLLLRRQTRLVVDYDDAVFHRYDLHRTRAVRAVLGQKIATLMERADAVTAGNAYLAEYARRAGAKRIEFLPSVVDTHLYQPAAVRKGGAGIRIGWVGTPLNAVYLQTIRPALERVLRGENRLVLVGAAVPEFLAGLPVEALAWREADEVTAIQGLDAGIMPLPDNPFERGKCGYKLIQYMACGLPVVASPVGANRDIVEEGVNGFLASSPEEWAERLERLAGDKQLRERMGGAGRQRVESAFSLEKGAERLLNCLGQVLE